MSETGSTPRRPWGKLDRDDSGRITRWQSLAEHSDDVATVFHALVTLPGIRRRLARTAGMAQLDEGTIARLAYLVFLHDCGKVNAGFQARADPKATRVGHIAPLAGLFGRRPDTRLSGAALSALNAELLETWGAGVGFLLDAVFSHHGKPWPRDNDGQSDAKYWRAAVAYDPIAELAILRTAADARFPHALRPDVPALPTAERFVHAVAGFVQLADWIGSSGWARDRNALATDAWTAQTLVEIGLDPSPWRGALITKANGFAEVFEREPYAHQAACGGAGGRLLILEAETGSGKTEAALWRFVTLFTRGDVDGLYFALPTRTAAAQLHARVEAVVHRIWPSKAPPVVMAVPGYLDDRSAGRLPESADALDKSEGDTRELSTWAAEHPKRFFSALIGVGTIDQALFATLRVKHAHLRGSSLLRHLLVVDEVHASDPYMQRLLQQLLRDHLAAGGYAMLLSATLGAESRQALMAEAQGERARDIVPVSLNAAIATPYPLISTEHEAIEQDCSSLSQTKTVRMSTAPCIEDASRIAALAVEAAHTGAKVLVVRNTVSGAVAVQRALEACLSDASPLLFALRRRATLHHGRFAREDRRLLDDAVERAIGRTRTPGGLIIVGTQTLEQSLDIDADFLITDLCPVDVLLQRLGRLHRHQSDGRGEARERPEAYRHPRCIVLAPQGGLGGFLSPRARAGGTERHGLGHVEVDGAVRGVYADVTVLEATRRLVEAHEAWKIPSMNRLLVESGLHSEAIETLLENFPDAERHDWRAHRTRVEGNDLAKQASASGSMLRRDRHFMEQGVEDAAHVTTRLGADDRLIRLPTGTIGPFGTIVSQLSVPGWMLRGIEAEAPLRIERAADTHTLSIFVGAQQFQYDAHGLHHIAMKR